MWEQKSGPFDSSTCFEEYISSDEVIISPQLAPIQPLAHRRHKISTMAKAKCMAPFIVLFLSLATLTLTSVACPSCVTPSPPPPEKTHPPPPPSPCPPPPPKKAYSPPPPPKKTPIPPPPPKKTCPIDTLKLDACVDLLGGLVHVVIGGGVTAECCPVLEGLADLDAALCLCTTIKAKALGISLLLPVALEVLADCGKRVPSDYQCPAN